MEEHMDIDEFMEKFISSGMAMAFEIANAKYVLGKSVYELMRIILQREPVGREHPYAATPAYWVGWVLAYAQWYLNRTFEQITDKFPCSMLILYYFPYHEMAISKSLDLIKEKISYDLPLRAFRKERHFTQEELARFSGVPLRSIRAYEQGKVELYTAQAETVYRLAKALSVTMEELVC
ncbi:MAG: helix-turn-helix domain-containing protein [Clostridia bacterium]|nr:helix-turn-helix domain-containing protein [Clostridia bacterium]